jgi:hypothetical protein
LIQQITNLNSVLKSLFGTLDLWNQSHFNCFLVLESEQVLPNTDGYKFYSEPEKTGNGQNETMFHGQNQVLEMFATGQSLKSTLYVLIQKAETQIKNICGSIFTLESSGKTFLTAAAPNLPEDGCNTFDGFKVSENVGSCGPAVLK